MMYKYAVVVETKNIREIRLERTWEDALTSMNYYRKNYVNVYVTIRESIPGVDDKLYRIEFMR